MSAKFGNLAPEFAFLPFREAMGACYGKVCADVNSWLGEQFKNTVSEQKDWKCGAAGKFKTSTGHKLDLPPNDARTILLKFGTSLNELGKAGEFTVKCDMLPKLCRAWIDEQNAKIKPAVENASPVAS